MNLIEEMKKITIDLGNSNYKMIIDDKKIIDIAHLRLLLLLLAALSLPAPPNRAGEIRNEKQMPRIANEIIYDHMSIPTAAVPISCSHV